MALDVALGRLESAVLGLLVGLLTAVTFAQVVFRYVLNDPLFWSDEAARYLFVWLALIGAAACVRTGAHYAMDAMVKRLPRVLRRVCGLAVLLAVAAFAATMLTYGALDTMNAARQESASLPFRMHWAYAAVPVSAALMLWHLLVRIVNGMSFDQSGANLERGIE
jgi:TRAP-type C4-dicarboxylate transport system permease small subunit